MKIDIRNVTKRFGDFTALNGVDLEVKSGELVALLGPSGSGKTTLLRIIAGLEWPDTGHVMFDGTDALSRSVRERHVGFVFQHYALFRHMSVFENIAFGLRVRPRRQRLSEEKIRQKVDELLDLVQLKWLADRYPSQLSGGQRQRIALARALAIEPRVLLLDEPFGALDAKVRKELRRWLRSLHEDIHVTSVFVTHDQEEALEVADRVVVMDKGRIEQVGAPEDVHDRPATAFVHEFIGESLMLPITVQDQRVHVEGRPLSIDPQGAANGAARLFVRPHEIDVVAADGATLTGVVKRVHGLGAARRVEVLLSAPETLVEIDTPRNLPVEVGATIGLKPQRYRIFADPH
ncbi:sulfate/molybdate ABC transporter ATP-binding protein [Pseudorhodoplanes sinuspersici]|uniref:Sulfate ABC transporter ATP-binding protein n=1 Tax=Pseudorhodoplanes sinuspersici TaxID=1235591 RepID=A0A1W6ZS17_9HYPH|nr:sulfate/molybdate ABC transporter ATP-binding protein [Pseudorhodoplanes sinuspersici]ARQ00187.1 sulfate ABC transporter ATP-binding protein [Pseudorhodoplanes sinuspersici]RKE67679.1 sulfate transport system ATP-binding protein [Pseudorhodoplanes sinuspersici]